jgi:hypothetical protein
MKRLTSQRSDHSLEESQNLQKRHKKSFKWFQSNFFRDMPAAIVTEIREFHMTKMFVSQPPKEENSPTVSFTE